MRDAFGGVFMMRLMLVFIVIFVAFSAISLNYAKAFRIKNQIIDVIEQMEIQNINDIEKNYSDKIDSIVENANYDKSYCKDGIEKDDSGREIGVCRSGITIKLNKERSTSAYIYYDVITYGGWNLRSLNMLLAISGRSQNSEEPMTGYWAITGEAKVKNHTKNVTPIQQDVPFDNKINSDRCYMGAWVKVSNCQPANKANGETDLNAQCWIDDNGAKVLVLRNELKKGLGCKWITSEYYDKINGYRCDKFDGTRYYIESCQLGTIIGARCEQRDGNPVIRADLKKCN